jgi:ribosome-associated heat shock protein Hsp15
VEIHGGRIGEPSPRDRAGVGERTMDMTGARSAKPTEPETAVSGEVRIDKWLWAARVFKARPVALEACRAGHVKIMGVAVKPGRPVRVGETIVVRAVNGVHRTLIVRGVSNRRVGPKLVGTMFEELTPPEELARAERSLVAQVLSRPKGAGRPTKRERRELDRWRL